MTHMTAAHTARRTVGAGSTKSERNRILHEIGRKLEPDPDTLQPGLIPPKTTSPGYPPLRLHRSPEQPSLSEQIKRIESRNRRRRTAVLAAAAWVAILAVSRCKQATPVRSDVCFVPREPAIEDARGISDGTNEKPSDGIERVVFSSVPNNKYFTTPHIPDTLGDGQRYKLMKRLRDGSSVTAKQPNE